VYRHSLPSQRWRFAAWIAVAYGVTYLHAAVRPYILRTLRYEFLMELYAPITTTVLMTATVLSIGFFVAAYYFSLRDRRLRTAMTEFGLAVRAILAGVFGLAGFVLFLLINDGSLLP
jgi:accessory gene regulator protein AgrB